MMAQPFAAHAGMGPGGGHPGLPHGHQMAGMQHPGAGHMGGPNPAMMQGMHPGVSGPQVTQGPMVAGMPQGPVTSGPGGPMQNAHAMAHLGPGAPNPMFQQQNQQIAFQQMPPQQQHAMMRQRAQLFHQMQQQQQQSNMPGMMQPHGAQNMTPQQFAQLKANMNMPMQQQMQLQAQANAQAQNLHQHQQQQQRLMAQQHQQQMLAQQHQQQQRNASQQMQLSRSQEQASQPPQSHPTPAPQNPAQMQQQTAPPTPAPGAQPKQQQPQQPNPQQQPQQNQVGTPQNTGDTAPIKQQDMGPNLNALEDVPMNEGMSNGLTGQGILRLLMFQEQLCPPLEKAKELSYWEEFVQNHFSPFGVLRQQLSRPKDGTQKIFQIQYASLARFYHAHFNSGVREMRMEPIGCTEMKLPHGGCNVWSPKTYITYGYDNDIRVVTEGSIQCNFDMANRIEHLSINTKSWTEYIPRSLWPMPDSPDQKQSPKLSKNLKRPQQKTPAILTTRPPSCVDDWGVPPYIVQFLEIAEVMMVMGPLMEFSQRNPGLRPEEAMHRLVNETARTMQFQNQMAAQQNGQIPMSSGQRTPGMNGPNQFASPAMNHLGLPQQGSPHVGGVAHTPSPAHMNQGGIAMVHQMSQGNSNLSGSQGPSTNTSPNVTNKRRRASQVKLEDDNASQEVNGANKVKPSPRIGGKRQKGTA